MAEEKELKELKVEDIKKRADEIGCPVQKALFYVSEFLLGPMCGRCFPCSMGSYEARIVLRNIIAGKGTSGELDNLKRIASLMLDSSMCKKGKDTAKFMLEWMDGGVISKHIEEGLCPEKMCCNYVEYRIIPEKCIICGLCKEVCQYDAIHGEKKKTFLSGYQPYEIRQQKCTKCSECIKVCPTGAIILADKKAKEPVGV